MIRVAVCGAGGRMGSLLASLLCRDRRFKLVGGTERVGNPLIGSFLSGGAPVTARLEELLPKIDVVIDFTSVEATLRNARLCGRARVRMVIGTTGWDTGKSAELRKFLRPSAAVLSPNMSPAVNLLFKLAGRAASSLPSYDAEIVEVHHNQKKDAPSGTALRLAEELNKARGGRLRVVHGRSGQPGVRRSNELGILSVRAGDVAGDHTVILAGPGERIELTHRAHSRETFARGALEAAAWIARKKPGLYDMFDVLGL